MNGELKPAINVTGTIIEAVQQASVIIIPQFQSAIVSLKGRNVAFRKEFHQWKIYESSTLKILASSSRRAETVIPEQVLAKFTFYNLIGKTLFYLTLRENLSGELECINIHDAATIKANLYAYFEKPKAIDYQDIFKPCFTDDIDYSDIVGNRM